MKILFVGIHNKPNTKPLDSSTKSGKLIDKIIVSLPQHTCIKTNLFDLNEIPKEIKTHQELWINTHNPTNNDIIILLGNNVHKFFPQTQSKTIKIKHPSAIWSKQSQENYISETIKKITY
jgi:hypothetical protein